MMIGFFVASSTSSDAVIMKTLERLADTMPNVLATLGNLCVTPSVNNPDPVSKGNCHFQTLERRGLIDADGRISPRVQRLVLNLARRLGNIPSPIGLG